MQSATSVEAGKNRALESRKGNALRSRALTQRTAFPFPDVARRPESLDKKTGERMTFSKQNVYICKHYIYNIIFSFSSSLPPFLPFVYHKNVLVQPSFTQRIQATYLIYNTKIK
jgi:hypothetical protein